MRKIMIISLGILLLVLSSSLLSAQLTITPSSFSINKTATSTNTVNFDLKNDGDVSFTNISFEDNNHITFPIINSLNPGQTAKINASIFSSQNFNGELRIKGFYESDLGQNFQTINVSANFNGVDKCDISIVQGDTVLFKNNEDDDMIMKNADTGEIVTTILPQQTYNINFNNIETFSYYLTNLGVPFTPVCDITVLSPSGFITNPDLDAILSLDVNIEFPPTTLEITLLETDHTIAHDSFKQDIFNIKNTGSNPARNVLIQAEWVTFSVNNFDLNPGESRNVGYTIDPFIISSNQTNITYKNDLLISGNFPRLNETLNIFIPQSTVEFFDESVESLESLMRGKFKDVQSYCNEQSNQLKDFCKTFKEIAGSSGNFTGLDDNIVLTEIAKAIRELRSISSKDSNENKLFRNETLDSILDIKGNNNQTLSTMGELRSDLTGLRSSISFTVLTALGLPVIIGGVFIALYMKRKKDEEEVSNFY